MNIGFEGLFCMPRVVLKPLETYPFRIDLPVRITDINYGGHLGNDRMLSLIHEARFAFLVSHGFSEMDCGGVSLTMTDVVINYLGQAFAGDVLRFEVSCGEPFRCGFRFYYRVTRPKDSKVIAMAETGMACLDYEKGTLLNLPDSVKKIMAEKS